MRHNFPYAKLILHTKEPFMIAQYNLNLVNAHTKIYPDRKRRVVTDAKAINVELLTQPNGSKCDNDDP